jgi:hypothetical protein
MRTHMANLTVQICYFSLRTWQHMGTYSSKSQLTRGGKKRRHKFAKRCRVWSTVMNKMTNRTLMLHCTPHIRSAHKLQAALLVWEIVHYMHISPLPVAAPSKSSVCGRSVKIAGSNPAGGMDVLSLVSVVSCQVEVCASG